MIFLNVFNIKTNKCFAIKKLIMRHLKINFETLPEVISIVLDELDQIKNLLNPKIMDEPPLLKSLTTHDLLSYLKENGIIVSKSKLYKLTSTNEIPHSKFNNKLMFKKFEIQKWIEENSKAHNINKDGAKLSVINSAKLKSRKR